MDARAAGHGYRRSLRRGHPLRDSQHLTVLKTAGLVTERRDGTRRLYRADRNEMKNLRKFLDEFWTSGLERLRDVAEAAQRNKEKR